MASTSVLDFSGSGVIALFHPANAIAGELNDVGIGDTIEVPGTAISNVATGAHSLAITTNLGTYTFGNVSFLPGTGTYVFGHDAATNLAELVLAPNTFSKVSSESLPPHAYLWSNPANWSGGVPVDGETLTVPQSGVDDIANLSVTSLTETGNAVVTVGGARLDILGLAFASGNGAIVAQSASGPVTVVIDAISGSGGQLQAASAGAFISDLAPTDPGETYMASMGGTVEIGAVVAAASILQFGTGGEFALPKAKGANAESLLGVAPGDRLELPGNAVVAFATGPGSLTVTTNAGTYAFTNVAYASPVSGVSAALDAATGLVALTFTDQARAADFNGDGTSDQLWQAASGALVDYAMANGNITGAAIVGGLDAGFRFLATGDFNGDGTADQLWQASGGAIVDYAMKGGAITGAAIVGSLDASFRFLAAADLNGDGTTDQLWQASSGAIIDFAMQGGAITVATGVGSLDATWKFLAAADFNGDGTADQLGQAANGTVVDYAMTNGTISAANVVGSFDGSMKFLAAADFNGDGRADLLWQNTTTGAIVDDTMNGAAIAATATVGALDATWKFLAAGDFNGDGTADQLWQAGSGAIVDFTMRNGAIVSGMQVGALDATYRFLA